MLASARRVVATCEQVLLVAAVLCVVAITAFTVWSVVARSVFNIGVVWSIELSEYLLVFVAFLAASIVQRQRRHVQAGLIFDRLTKRGQQYVEAVVSVAVLIAATLFLIYGFGATLEDYRRGVVIYNFLMIERWIVYLPTSVGVLVLTARFLIDAIDAIAAVRQGNGREAFRAAGADPGDPGQSGRMR